MTEPASIRCKNPGAMWGRVGRKPTSFFPTPQGPHGCETNAPIPLKWGSKKTIYLSDGMGQNNNIAIFDTWVQGICAQLDLWRTSKNYRNKRFADAIRVWAGGNNVPSYISYVKARVPGMNENTVMDDAFWKSPMGIAFLKAQAGHEAGKTYPAPEADWIEAQRRVFGKVATTKAATTAVVVNTATTTAAAQAHSSGASPAIIICIIAAGLIIAGVAWYFIRKRAA
jgi:hypothetical protein